jgi:energy-coupling factor transport system permease protein
MVFKNITIGQYIPGTSALHRADPRTKIILTLAFMVVVFLLNSFPTMIAMACFTILCVIVSGIPFRYTLRGLKPILIIIIFTTVINLFATKGTPIVDYGILRNITYEGVSISILLAIRLSILIIGASLLTFTTTPILLTDGIEKLLSPFKKLGLPAHELAMMMTIALRFIPTLVEETDKIIKAQASRGADFDTGNIVQRAKSFVPVLVPLFVGSFRRADELATAMEARCYKGSAGRTRMRQLAFSRVDLLISAIMALFSAGLLILEYM